MRTFERTRQQRRDVADAGTVAAAAGWRTAVGVLAVVILVGLIGVGIWWFKVATSDVKGAGDATRITNDGRNRVNAQEWFQGQYQLIRSTDARIDIAAADLAAAERVPGKDTDFYRATLTGLKNRCLEMVGAYNAEANKVSRAQWRDVSLPAQIDQTAPETDCKESATR